MGKITGFLDYERVPAGYRPVDERLRDYRDVTLPPSRDQVTIQAARCMDCGVPFCHSMGCPVLNLIPEFNDLVYQDKWHEAYLRLQATNNFPEFTGRLCPAPCETACTLAINAAAVSIKQIELSIIEYAFEKGWVKPLLPKQETGKRIAVIGSGPAGLAAAQQLRRAGHRVTVFEKDSKVGGIMRYGIPDFKLERHILDRRIQQLIAEGIVLETNVTVGEDISVRYLRHKFDVVLLTLGAGKPRDLHVAGRGLEGIHFAMEYLTQSNKLVSGEEAISKPITARNKTVLVIGGGDTGADCVGTANRQGAKKVYQFEILDKPQKWDKPHNPNWPYWPRIMRTQSSHEEGCERRWNVTTKQFTSRSIHVSEVHCQEVIWEFDPRNKRPIMVEKPDTEFSMRVDLVLLAMGFEHVSDSKLLQDLDVQSDEHGNITVDSNYMTTTEGVFAAGDCNEGASLIVNAIQAGRCAAEGINFFLTNEA